MTANSATLFALIEARKPKLAVILIGVRRRGVGRDNALVGKRLVNWVEIWSCFGYRLRIQLHLL
jgi:hypothetical protein